MIRLRKIVSKKASHDLLHKSRHGMEAKMSRKNKSAEFINDCIADALLQLMEEKPIEKITAQEITDLAGVGRATFFRHFRSKDEILTYKLIRLWNRWVIDHDLSTEGHFSLSNTEDLLAF